LLDIPSPVRRPYFAILRDVLRPAAASALATTSNGELLQQRRGDLCAGGGHGDPIIGLQLGVAQAAVGQHQHNIPVARPFEIGLPPRAPNMFGHVACLTFVNGLGAGHGDDFVGIR
jgi:hypothetical protein